MIQNKFKDISDSFLFDSVAADTVSHILDWTTGVRFLAGGGVLLCSTLPSSGAQLYPVDSTSTG